MKIAIIVGTRPEIIKMSPIIRACQARNIEFVLIHSNQHYSENMDAIFFKELTLPAPAYNLNIGSGTRAKQVASILSALEPILKKEKPDIMLVLGDTTTVVAAALTADALDLPVGHIEAGLRSYDRSMPEEGNRIVTDHISDFLFAVTEVQADRLRAEGIASDTIFTVGNTIVDAVLKNKEIASTQSHILDMLGLVRGEYCLFTAHRPGNVDTKESLEETLALATAIPIRVVWPMHVRTKKRLKEYGLTLPEQVVTTDPLGYLDFLNLEQHATYIVTDSGGVQEEACILGVPCITIRENTERPETVTVGANRIVGRSIEKLKAALRDPYPSAWKNPFGYGTTADTIMDILVHQLAV